MNDMLALVTKNMEYFGTNDNSVLDLMRQRVYQNVKIKKENLFKMKCSIVNTKIDIICMTFSYFDMYHLMQRMLRVPTSEFLCLISHI